MNFDAEFIEKAARWAQYGVIGGASYYLWSKVLSPHVDSVLSNFRKQTYHDLYSHRHIMGAFRAGKSTLMLHMIQEAATAEEQESRRPAIIILDPHGSLAEDARVILKRAGYDIYWDEPSVKVFPVNPLHTYDYNARQKEFAVENVVALFQELDPYWGHKQLIKLRDILWWVVNSNYKPTLIDVLNRAKELEEKDKSGVADHVEAVLHSPTLKTMFSSWGADFWAFFKPNTAYIAKLDNLGQQTQDTAYAVRTMQIQQAAFARPHDGSATPVLLFADEIQRALKSADGISTMLTELGKYNISVTLAHHVVGGQLSDYLQNVIWLCGSHYLFRLSKKDSAIAAAILGRDFDLDVLTRLRNYQHVRVELRGGRPTVPKVVYTPRIFKN